MRDKRRLAKFATILTSLLVGMTFAVANSTYAASAEKNVVIVKVAVVNPIMPPKVLVFPIVIKEQVEKVKVEKADSKVLVNRNEMIKTPVIVRNPFFFEEPFEEFD